MEFKQESKPIIDEISRESQLQNAIESYLNNRLKYFKETYPGFEDIMIKGEKEMIENSLKMGRLSTWKPGENILACITKSIEKSVTNLSGSIDVGDGINIERFSPQVLEEIQKAKSGTEGYSLVSMNEGKTVSNKSSKDKEVKILSLGQGGCTNVVIVGRNADDEILASVFHFSPTNTLDLLDCIIKVRQQYSDSITTKAIIFTTTGFNPRDLSFLGNTIEQFPNMSLEQGSTDKEGDVDNLLMVGINKDGGVNISMKQQNITWQI